MRIEAPEEVAGGVADTDHSETTAGAQAATFLDEAFSRNADVISRGEQAALSAMGVLVAGCGSVGGAVVEPLARLGVLSFALADPDVYELSNLNRQACYLADVGRPKASVLAERVTAINPYARALAYDEGLTVGNIPQALRDIDVVFDGMDGAMSPWEKYTLHAEAAQRRIPVVAGADFGGKPVLYVFDYRVDQRPFYGRGRSEHHREGRFVESVRWLGYRPIPRDFMPIIANRLATGDPWPQIAYCVSGMAAIGSRTVLDVALGRPVRHIVAVDVHDATRTPRTRAGERLRWPLTAMRTLAAVRGSSARRAAPPATLPELPTSLLTMVKAAHVAPSAHNAQPVRLIVKGPQRIVLDWDRSRALMQADGDGHGICYGVGCAIEAMSAVGEIEFQPAPGTDPLATDWYAGEIAVGELHPDLALQQAVLRHRGTTRTPYYSDRVADEDARAIEAAAACHGATLLVQRSAAALSEVADLTATAATAQLGDPAYLEELLAWTRLSAAEADRSPDGFTPETLALDPGSVAFMRTLRANALLRQSADTLGLAKAMAEQSSRALIASGGIALLVCEVAGPADRIRAGRALMAVWLASTRARLAVQPVFSALGSPPTHAAVRDLFDVPAGLEAIALLRLGRTRVAPPTSPRLPLEQICSVDRVEWRS